MVNHRDGFVFVAAGDGDIRSSAIVTDYDDGSVVKYKFKIETLLIGSVLSRFESLDYSSHLRTLRW